VDRCGESPITIALVGGVDEFRFNKFIVVLRGGDLRRVNVNSDK